MLDKLTAADFSHATGTTCKLVTADGFEIPVVVDTVKEKPQFANPYVEAERRTPFMVTLNSLEPTPFCDGSCDIVFGDGKRLAGIDVSRVAPLGRDPQLGYFQMIFN
jgi:hypothetical protein